MTRRHRRRRLARLLRLVRRAAAARRRARWSRSPCSRPRSAPVQARLVGLGASALGLICTFIALFVDPDPGRVQRLSTAPTRRRAAGQPQSRSTTSSTPAAASRTGSSCHRARVVAAALPALPAERRRAARPGRRQGLPPAARVRTAARLRAARRLRRAAGPAAGLRPAARVRAAAAAATAAAGAARRAAGRPAADR